MKKVTLSITFDVDDAGYSDTNLLHVGLDLIHHVVGQNWDMFYEYGFQPDTRRGSVTVSKE